MPGANAKAPTQGLPCGHARSQRFFNQRAERSDFMETLKKHQIAYTVLSVVLLFFIIWTVYQHNQIKSLKTGLENNYNRAFHELVDYVDDIDTLLQKSMLVSSPAQMSTISGELFRQSSAAKACLGQLPISEVQLENTEKFLSQVGDYTYVLSQSVINNNKITDEEYENLMSLGEYAKGLNKGLVDMQQDIYEGNINFNTVAREGDEHFSTAQAAGESVLSGFEKVEKEFQEYPSLIYDGPFSEHMETAKPMMLEGEKEISVDEAKNIAKEFLGDRGNSLIYSEESQNSPMDFYTFRAADDTREIVISLTKKGGHILYFLDSRAAGEEALGFPEAVQRAKQFLSDRGYTSLKESYYEKTNGIATINFAYTQSNVVCYSDLLKVKVALDTGEILGLEAHGYIMNHRHRDLPAPVLTQAQAQEKINSHLAVDGTDLVLIPKDSMREVLCYEFRGNFNGSNFLIYINAENGREEKILMLIESEDGILTV